MPRSSPIELDSESTSCFGAGSGFTSTGLALLASSTSSLGACRVCGSETAMTLAACATETVGPPVVVVADALADALTFASVPGSADPLDGVTGEPLGGGMSSITELGAT